MTRFTLVSALCIAMLLPAFAKAQDMLPMMHHMDDQVMLGLSAEDWVTTKTARVDVNVEAAVSASNAGTMRADMMKAVNDLVKADWRLTAFNRSEDQTGLERWSTSFEARVPESQLGGLNEAAKKLSKAGMQLTVGGVDFSPTLEETEAARAALRIQIYKQANDQLAALNAAIPGRTYRISMIDFTEGGVPFAMQRVMRTADMNAGVANPMPAVERSQKLTINAHVVFAAMPERGPAPVPAADVRH